MHQKEQFRTGFGNFTNIEKIKDIWKIKSYHLKVHRCEYIIQQKRKEKDIFSLM